MSTLLWAQRRPPQRLAAAAVNRWTGTPDSVPELTALRAEMRDAMLVGTRSGGTTDDHVERLLLAFEELASNGMRHGRQPVRVAVEDTGEGWLLTVSDSATDRPPEPAVGRDAAHGGLGLYLVARLCTAHGWSTDGESKHVWAFIEYTADT